jgi:hypothetical protein
MNLLELRGRVGLAGLAGATTKYEREAVFNTMQIVQVSYSEYELVESTTV